MFKLAKTILKNLFSSPPTRKYPYVTREPFKRARGHVDININDCVFCGACQKQCPVGAISVDRDAKTWEVDNFKCITCEYCTEKCPKKCLSMGLEYSKPGTEKTVFRAVQSEKENKEK